MSHDVNYEPVTSVSCGTVVPKKLFITQNISYCSNVLFRLTSHTLLSYELFKNVQAVTA